MRLLGALLAGGRSRRFGSDKAQALLDGRPLIDWAAAALSGHVERVLICGRAGGLPDRPGPDLGPLGGLNAALHVGRSEGFDAVLTVPCDAPLIPEGAFAALLASGGPAFLAECPVIGVWPCALAGALDARLEGEDRSIRGWAASVGATPVRLDRAIVNVNCVEDLQHLAAGPR
jgi:molybdopterin-guanine dinucleotide biosynthesis protein A